MTITQPIPPGSETYDIKHLQKAQLVDREGNIWYGDYKGIHRFFYTPLIRQEFSKNRRIQISRWLLMTMGRYGSVREGTATIKRISIMSWAAKPSVISRG